MSVLSIIIVSYNARADLERCLESLRDAPPALDHEIIVVDNASADGSAAGARAFTTVRVVALDRNAGFAAASNVGIRGARGDLLLMLNSDTIVRAGALDCLIGRLDAMPEAAIAGPRLVDGDGRAELSFGRMLSPLAELRQKTINAFYARRVPLAERWVEAATHREQFVDWVSGACLLVRRADAEGAGLLDERYFMYAEDVDFCHAVRARGRRVLFTPAGEVVHLRGRSRASAPAEANLAYRRSHVAFYEKHHPGWARLLKLYLRMKGQSPPASR